MAGAERCGHRPYEIARDSHIRGRTESSAPTMGGKECAKWEVEDGVPYEEVYGDTAVRCGRNQLGGGA